MGRLPLLRVSAPADDEVMTGMLGSRIAFQVASRGHSVVACDISDEVLEKARARCEVLAETYVEDGVDGAGDGAGGGAGGGSQLNPHAGRR